MFGYPIDPDVSILSASFERRSSFESVVFRHHSPTKGPPMPLRRHFLKTIAWSLALAPVAVRADDNADELKKFDGSWISKDPNSGDATWTFEKGKLKLEAPGRSYKITIKVDTAAKPHKTMDMKVDEDSPNAKNFDGPAIYKFDGEDKISICFGTQGHPTEFMTKDDFSAFNFELTRKK